jgi:aryl-alcohol dehydrogenase-like predicted oxidoreductase
MTFGATSAARPLATLVLRLWLAGTNQQPETCQLQATHVQTGEVTYFRTIEGLAQHIERLAKQLAAGATTHQPPINLSEVRRRSESEQS